MDTALKKGGWPGFMNGHGRGYFAGRIEELGIPDVSACGQLKRFYHDFGTLPTVCSRNSLPDISGRGELPLRSSLEGKNLVKN
jgi:hypothetical protein